MHTSIHTPFRWGALLGGLVVFCVPTEAGASDELPPGLPEAVHLIRNGWIGKSFFESIKLESRIRHPAIGRLTIWANAKSKDQPDHASATITPGKDGYFSVGADGLEGPLVDALGLMFMTHTPVELTWGDGQTRLILRRKDKARYLAGAAESDRLQTHEIALTFKPRSDPYKYDKLVRAEVVYGDTKKAKGRYVWRAPRKKAPASWEIVLPGEKNGVKRFKGQRLRDLKRVRN